MQQLPYVNRDYDAVFNSIRDIITTLEPRAEVGQNKANVESILAKIFASVTDVLSYNQDANIYEAFPSTARDIRSVFDLLSIVGYTPKTTRSCKLYLTLWNPSFSGSVTYNPYTRLSVDGKNFYNPDSFTCAPEITANTEWYQGNVITPDLREKAIGKKFIDKYYPNISITTLKNNAYALPEDTVNLDSRTIRIYLSDGRTLTYVENPYLVYTTPFSFGVLPNINAEGYSLIFSDDIASGSVTDNLYYFYINSEGYNVGNNLTPDFSGFGDPIPSFSFTYVQEESSGPETANEARKNVAYEFGWRDTPKAIITKYDAERAVLQNLAFVAAVCVKDGDDYSKVSPDNFEVSIFIKTTEQAEETMTTGTALALKDKIMTHLNKFKALPLSYNIHIDNIDTVKDEDTTTFYYWYPDITVYLKEQVDSKTAGEILTQINTALFKRYEYKNLDFNSVPRIVDVLDTVQNAINTILYLDIDGLYYVDSEDNQVTKEDVTGKYTTVIPITSLTKTDNGYKYTTTLTTKQGNNIQYHTIKIVDADNNVIGIDNGDGLIISFDGYLGDDCTIDYTTGELVLNLNYVPLGTEFYIYHKLENPTFCMFTNRQGNIKIALESIKAND